LAEDFVFEPARLTELQNQHSPLLNDLSDLEQQLKTRFPFLDAAIDAMILSVASGEPLLLIGPPGTAKSRLVRAFCHAIGVIDSDYLTDRSVAVPAGAGGRREMRDEKQRSYFEYLLTQFTEPGELFGFFDLTALNRKDNPRLERNEDGMMQRATVVFLDEVFNASSAILNSLLTFMNEGRFHDRGVTKPAAMECLFAATNGVPAAPELRALFDRFVLRCWIDLVPPTTADVAQLIDKGFQETYAPPFDAAGGLDGLLAAARTLRADINMRTRSGALAIDRNDPVITWIAQLTKIARDWHLSDMSNRRIVKFVRIMLINALLRASRSGTTPRIDDEDVGIIWKFGFDRPADSHDFKRLLSMSP
jgi:MoxR-like ATPase